MEFNLNYVNDELAEKVDINPNFSEQIDGGIRILYHRDSELRDLKDYQVEYYENGVLLVYKEKFGEYKARSYYFYNNNGQQVFGITNFKPNNPNNPDFSIGVTVFKTRVAVYTKSHITQVVEERSYDVKTAKIIRPEEFNQYSLF